MKLKAIAVSILIPVAGMAQIQYPQTKKVDQKDIHHGVEVADPYRWLEDDRSAETGEWVKAQNKVTDAFLSQIPYRKQLQDRLEKVFR